MPQFFITTNEVRNRIVNTTEKQVQEAMRSYIRTKREKGLKLVDIVFMYQSVKYATTTLASIVGRA